MKRVRDLLKREANARKLNNKALAELADIDQAQLSRFMKEKGAFTTTMLRNFFLGFKDSEATQRELLIAYFLDTLEGDQASQQTTMEAVVEEALNDSKIRESPAPYNIKLVQNAAAALGINAKTAEALGRLALEARGNIRLQNLLGSLAEFFPRQ